MNITSWFLAAQHLSSDFAMLAALSPRHAGPIKPVPNGRLLVAWQVWLDHRLLTTVSVPNVCQFQFSYDEWQEVYDILFQDRYASIQTHFGELLLGRCWAQQKVTWVSFQVRVSLWSCLLKHPILRVPYWRNLHISLPIYLSKSWAIYFWWFFMITFAMKSGRHSGCRCFTCFTSDQASMEPSDGPLAFLVQFAAFTFFLLLFPRGNHFPGRFHHVFVVFDQGKSNGGTRGFHGRRNSWTSCKAERLPRDACGTEWKNWPLLDRFGKISAIFGYCFRRKYMDPDMQLGIVRSWNCVN